MVYKEIPYQVACINRRCTIDLYFKIKDDYRLFAAKGAELTDEFYLQFKKMKLFIKGENHAAAEKCLDDHMVGVLTDPEMSSDVKAVIAYSLSMKSIREVFLGTSMKSLSGLKTTARHIVGSILSDGKVVEDFINISSIDHFMLQHSVKVGVFGIALCINLFGDKLSEHKIEELSTAFFLHDIGMTKVPSTILDKADELSPSDWEVIRKHPLWGHDKLVRANYMNDEAAAIVLYHHERCNGKGYPFKKSGDEIPLYARICAIADTFESLTSGRVYRKPKSPFEALKIMHVEMAHEFDEDLFRAFVTMLGSHA